MSESSHPRGDHEWRAVLDGLPDGERRIVLDAAASGIFSGWNPSRRDVDHLVAVRAREVTGEQRPGVVGVTVDGVYLVYAPGVLAAAGRCSSAAASARRIVTPGRAPRC